MKHKLLVFDTSYLVRLYLEDKGFEGVRALALSTHRISAAWHGQAEVIAAFHRIYREKKISKYQCSDLIDQFRADCSTSLFQWLELNERVSFKVTSFFKSALDTLFLRAADALHIAAAAEHGFGEIYSHDRHLLVAASFFGIHGINILN